VRGGMIKFSKWKVPLPGVKRGRRSLLDGLMALGARLCSLLRSQRLDLTVQEKHIIYIVGDAQARFIRMKSTSKTPPPSIVNLTVKRRYLTQREIERLMDCARKHVRYGHRDATMILVAYRHGLRASEVCDLQWQQIELSEGRLHVHRVKNGIPSVHPIRGDEMRALRKLRREYPKDAHVFVSERGGPICQRRSKTASACRSKNTSVMLARRVPELGAFSSDIMLGSDYPPACPSWHGVSCACSD